MRSKVEAQEHVTDVNSQWSGFMPLTCHRTMLLPGTKSSLLHLYKSRMCLHVFVCACAHMCVWVCFEVHVCTCIWKPEKSLQCQGLERPAGEPRGPAVSASSALGGSYPEIPCLASLHGFSESNSGLRSCKASTVPTKPSLQHLGCIF